MLPRESREMTGQCCVSGRGPHPLARGLSQAIASILPAALLVLLPKCPLCLAMWLTVATGVTFSAAGAVWLRGAIVLLWTMAVGLLICRRRWKLRQPGA